MRFLIDDAAFYCGTTRCIQYQATEAGCTALPTIPNADAGNCQAPSANGATCTPVCKTGFTGTLSGMTFFGEPP